MTAECVKTYALAIDEYGNITGEFHGGYPSTSGKTSPSEVVDKLARELTERRPNLTYRDAVNQTLQERPDLARAYAVESAGRVPAHAPSGDDPAAEAHEMAMEIVDNEPGVGYSEAAARVLRENPRLNRRWCNYTSMERAQ